MYNNIIAKIIRLKSMQKGEEKQSLINIQLGTNEKNIIIYSFSSAGKYRGVIYN